MLCKELSLGDGSSQAKEKLFLVFDDEDSKIKAEEKKIHDEKVEQAKEIAEKRKTITLEFSAPAGRNGDRIGTVSFKKASEARKKV